MVTANSINGLYIVPEPLEGITESRGHDEAH